MTELGAIALEVLQLLLPRQHILLRDVLCLSLALATFLVKDLIVVYVI